MFPTSFGWMHAILNPKAHKGKREDYRDTLHPSLTQQGFCEARSVISGSKKRCLVCKHGLSI